jgi:hypothetical protein
MKQADRGAVPKKYRITVYRCGSLTPASYDGGLLASSVAADTVKPVGKAGRTHSLYASTSLESVGRWVSSIMDANMHGHGDVSIHAITIDARKVNAYSVTAWERFSADYDDGIGDASTYWGTGIPLMDYMTTHTNDDDTEVLFTPDDIISVRPVGYGRLLNHQSDPFLKQQLSCKIALFERYHRGDDR